MFGLVTVSTNSAVVFGLIAARTASMSRTSTSDTSMPIAGQSSSKNCRLITNRSFVTTTCSPAFAEIRIEMATAAMPDDVTSAASVFSSEAILASSAAVVGFAVRE